MADRNNFQTFTKSAQDALFFNIVNDIAQKFGASAYDLSGAQVQALLQSGRAGAMYDVLAGLNTALGLSNAGATDGLGALKVARATFNPSGVTGHRSIASHGLGVTVPDNAVVVGAWYDVITTCADGVADAATIALTLQAAGDLKAAIAISDATNVWDAGEHGLLPGNFALDGNALTAIAMAAAKAASYIKLTAAREITATVGGVALTAGKLNVFVAYTVGD